LTISYRRDSSAWFPSGVFRPLSSKDSVYNETFARKLLSKKTRPVAWFAGECKTFSKRENYVNALQKQITVDKYGNCGTLKCDRLNNECWTQLSSNYWFYLAFENSVCNDYVTEKFYESAAQFVIPIVLKRSLLKNLAPNNSFIAVDDFKSAEALANHLKYLMKNVDKYLLHFEWKKTQTVHIGPWRHQVAPPQLPDLGWCKICDRVASGDHYNAVKDIKKWWVDDGGCDPNYLSGHLG